MSLSSSPPGSTRRSGSAFQRIGLLVLMGLCVLFVSSYANRLARKAEVEQEIREWEQQVADAELHQQELQAELDYVNSPAYIEDVARNHLDMARKGDTVIVVVPGRPAPRVVGQPGDAAADGGVPQESDTATGEAAVENDVAGAEAPREAPALPAVDEPTWKQWFLLLAGEEQQAP